MLFPITKKYINKKKNYNNTIFFYNWTEYVPQEILNQFTKETGIKIIYSTYDSNESMYTKLKTHKKQSYDLVVPSTYFVSKMKNEGMIQKIKKNKIPNFKNLDPKFLNKSFDINNKYSIPYMWGATAIGVNTNFIDYKQINSWNDLWNPKYYKSISLIDDAKEVFQMSLIKLKLIKDNNINNIYKAFIELKKLMPNVISFNADNPGYPFIEGSVNIGMIWNGSAYIIQKLGIPLKFIWPKEGSIFWMDNFVIPSNAKNVQGALQLINFLLRPDIAAKIVKKIGFSTPNLGARKFLPLEMVNNNILFPNNKIINNGIWQNNNNDNVNKQYEIYFQKLKNL
ncbi:extracellular solute-binding protein [Enterobacteriaceae endosymbiont of Donacia provostii]|uniref:extracellular solute-binding protein n=1 Tax=Enterobacteriaceae endosymbiont of Donacia provostii TaxID=2675781 RepID=UPI001449FB48|nr:extracellular solute-binding protein [Enterobacteriaceae endosymbiont of Donacia provostii]